MLSTLQEVFPHLIRAYEKHEHVSDNLGAAERWESAWRAAAYADAIDGELIVDSDTQPKILLWASLEEGLG